MIEKTKKILHKYFIALGFDIRSVKNLDIALRELEKERQRLYLQNLANMRAKGSKTLIQNQSVGFGEQKVNIAWVAADDLLQAAIARMIDANIVLDIGCGIRPQQYVLADIHICCEPFDEYLHRLIFETSINNKYVYLNCDFQTTVQIFPPHSVDTIFLIDVIEHIDRSVVLYCLQKALNIARSQLVVFTPIGLMPQKSLPKKQDQWGMSGGEWQEHVSAWQPEDFPAYEGWEIIACKDFHKIDAFGKKFDQPFGAMWAINNKLN